MKMVQQCIDMTHVKVKKEASSMGKTVYEEFYDKVRVLQTQAAKMCYDEYYDEIKDAINAVEAQLFQDQIDRLFWWQFKQVKDELDLLFNYESFDKKLEEYFPEDKVKLLQEYTYDKEVFPFLVNNFDKIDQIVGYCRAQLLGFKEAFQNDNQKSE